MLLFSNNIDWSHCDFLKGSISQATLPPHTLGSCFSCTPGRRKKLNLPYILFYTWEKARASWAHQLLRLEKAQNKQQSMSWQPLCLCISSLPSVESGEQAVMNEGEVDDVTSSSVTRQAFVNYWTSKKMEKYRQMKGVEMSHTFTRYPSCSSQIYGRYTQPIHFTGSLTHPVVVWSLSIIFGHRRWQKTDRWIQDVTQAELSQSKFQLILIVGTPVIKLSGTTIVRFDQRIIYYHLWLATVTLGSHPTLHSHISSSRAWAILNNETQHNTYRMLCLTLM